MLKIRPFAPADQTSFISLATQFYSLPAVAHPVPASVFAATFAQCMQSSAYIHGYMLTYNGQTAGYALVAITFSAEVGGTCAWLEELYILPQWQGQGFAHTFFTFLHQKYVVDFGAKRLRLEATRENVNALRLYEQLGFTSIDYLQLAKDF